MTNHWWLNNNMAIIQAQFNHNQDDDSIRTQWQFMDNSILNQSEFNDSSMITQWQYKDNTMTIPE